MYKLFHWCLSLMVRSSCFDCVIIYASTTCIAKNWLASFLNPLEAQNCISLDTVLGTVASFFIMIMINSKLRLSYATLKKYNLKCNKICRETPIKTHNIMCHVHSVHQSPFWSDSSHLLVLLVTFDSYIICFQIKYKVFLFENILGVIHGNITKVKNNFLHHVPSVIGTWSLAMAIISRD